MKQFFVHVLAFLGAIFLLVIIALMYFFITDPYNIKPLLFGGGLTPSFQSSNNTSDMSTDEHADATASAETADVSTAGGFALSEAQKQALVSVGIDPSAVPDSISAEQESCFVSALGEARVAEIKAGAVPNALEFLKAKSCI